MASGFQLTKYFVIFGLLALVWISGGFDILFREPVLLIFGGVVLVLLFSGDKK